MLFNSAEFLIFLPIVFGLYWFVFKSLRSQNLLITAASLVFYGWWDYRFLGLIIFSIFLDYICSLAIQGTDDPKRRKLFLGISLLGNLGLLAFFKYFNFFIESWVEAWAAFGVTMEVSTLRIILPVGISFYTFQTLSYTIDVYRRELRATPDFIAFTAYVSFFPQLVAGPIERAVALLPQILQPRKFDKTQAVDGIRLMIWGFVKKIAIADTLSPLVSEIFANHQEHGFAVLLTGAVLFAFQIYGDFSGYSDIAIGLSKLFGFELMSNFRFPYFSRDIAEFWRRWHISLSTWFRDYVYIPLGGSKGGKYASLRNIFIIFLVSGFWHGANWTFVIWGGIHALLYVPLFVFNLNRKNTGGVLAENSWFPSFSELAGVLITFVMVTLAWVFFRAESASHALEYLAGLGRWDIHLPEKYAMGLLILVPFVLAEYVQRKDERQPWLMKNDMVLMASILLCLFAYFRNIETEFIYFQF